MESKSAGPILPLYEIDVDARYMIDEFPADYECPSCMMVQQEFLTCKHCEQICCKACLSGFAKQGDKKIASGQYECLICHKVDTFMPHNRIMA